MNHRVITNFKSWWDFDNKFGQIQLFFENGENWVCPKISADEFAAMMSILQHQGVIWHVPTKSLVKD